MASSAVCGPTPWWKRMPQVRRFHPFRSRLLRAGRPTFPAVHNDRMNPYPAVGHVNGQRSNYNWGRVSRGETWGRCEIVIDSSIRRVQPPTAVRGDIARTMLYMRDTYGFRLSRQDEQLYGAWNNEDPPDAWEIERVRRIKAIQGKGNAYVENYRRL